MSREVHVRFCEGLEVQFPRPTHPFVPTSEGWLYVAAVMNVKSRRVIGLSMSDKFSQELASSALRAAASRQSPAEGLIHHSDRGRQ